jgi:hypothetical protein
VRERKDAFLCAIQTPSQIGHCILFTLQLGHQHFNPDPQDFLGNCGGYRRFLLWFRSHAVVPITCQI